MTGPVNTKKELIERLLNHGEKIRGFGVERLGLFGSFVYGTVNQKSDVDFLIHFDPQQKSFKNFMALAAMLEEITGRKIDIVTPQALSKYIGPYILKEVEYVPIAA